jgi:hypothetical protein
MTTLDALQNAKCNFETLGRLGLKSHPIYLIAIDQLSNAIKALENGKAPNDVLQEHMFGDVKTGSPT